VQASLILVLVGVNLFEVEIAKEVIGLFTFI
jgi:hypothetical protein